MLKFRIPFLILSLATALLSISSCTNEASLLGLDLLPSNDKNAVKYTVTNDVEGFIFRVDTVMTSHGSVSFLGLINDPVFGKTEASIITQFIYTSKAPDFGDNPVADSIFIFFAVKDVWGDSLTPLGFDLYEMNTNLYDTSYYNTFDPTGLYNPERVGTVEVIPQDTFILKIPVSLEYGQRLVETDTSLTNQKLKFLDEFSGFYLQPRLPNGGIGSLIKVDYFDKKSQLLVYYHNEDKDSLTFALQPTAYSASSTEQRQVDRITIIKHDYSNTSFNQSINDTVNPPSSLYYLAPAGLGIRLVLRGIESWLDSGKVSFEKVILEIPVDKTDDVSLFKRPVALNLFQKRQDSTFYYIFDHYMNGVGTNGLPSNPWDSYYGKNLQNDSLYRFTITNHYQRALNSKDSSPDLFIFSGTSSQFGRVVFKNDEGNKIRLKITYSLH